MAKKNARRKAYPVLKDNDEMFKAIVQAKKDLGIEYNPMEDYRK